MSFPTKTTFTFNHADQSDVPSFASSALFKAALDSRSGEMLTFVNAIKAILVAVTDGASGADNIGATAVSGLSGATVQALIESLKTALDEATTGTLPDRSITAAKIALLAITAAEIANSTITTTQIASDTVALSNLATSIKPGSRGGKLYLYRNQGGF